MFLCGKYINVVNDDGDDDERTPALFPFIVDDLVQKYGQGEVSIRKCSTCNF